jgi:hypothetical protein
MIPSVYQHPFIFVCYFRWFGEICGLYSLGGLLRRAIEGVLNGRTAIPEQLTFQLNARDPERQLFPLENRLLNDAGSA